MKDARHLFYMGVDFLHTVQYFASLSRPRLTRSISLKSRGPSTNPIMGRKRLSSAKRKKKRNERDLGYRKIKLIIFIGKTKQDWEKVKRKFGLRTNEAVARLLLNVFER